MDTALSVATEMVAELDITDQDVTKIADMIDGEIASLVPDWKPGPGIEETPRFANSSFCQNCASNHTSNGSFLSFLSNNPEAKHLQVLQCSGNGCALMHGRFEEITYQVDGHDEHFTSNSAENPNLTTLANGFHRTESWNQNESLECSSLGSRESCSDEEHRKLNKSTKNKNTKNLTRSLSGAHSLSGDYEHEIQQELRWVRAKYQMELMELRDKQLGIVPKTPRKQKIANGVSSTSFVPKPSKGGSSRTVLKSFVHSKHFSPNLQRNVQKSDAVNAFPKADDIVIAKSYYTHHRTKSLPVDAIDI